MNTRPISKLIVLLTALFVSCTQQTENPNVTGTIEFEGLEFEMPAISTPVIPDLTVSIVDFGAVSGGSVINTQAFTAAIDAVTQKGGGRVVIPAGIWLTGPIELKSKLELHAEAGAVIVFSNDKDLYPLINTSFEGLDTWRCMSPITGIGLEDVAFTGKGVWDGSGDAWRFVKRAKLTEEQWKKLVASGGIVSEKGTEWYPSEQYMKAATGPADQNVRSDLKTKEDFMTIRDFLRPVMLSIVNSKRVMLDGPTFQNSPAWCLHPLMIEDLIVRNVTVRNPWYSQNGDGLDVESCKNVLVENCSFDVGDDAICIKSGKDADGRKRGIPCENLVIRSNIVFHGHGGVTVGSEMSGGVKNMHVSNCTFIGTDVGLRFKSNRGRGGVVEGIYISDIQMKDIPTFAISFNLYYGGKSASEMLEAGGEPEALQEMPVTEETPQFKDILISDIEVDGAMQAVQLQGLPEMNLENVKLNDMILSADKGIVITDAKNVRLKNIKLTTKNGKAVEITNSTDLEINELYFPFEKSDAISVKGAKSSAITINTETGQKLEGHVSIGDEVDKVQIVIR
jgi:polygalacturonase